MRKRPTACINCTRMESLKRHWTCAAGNLKITDRLSTADPQLPALNSCRGIDFGFGEAGGNKISQLYPLRIMPCGVSDISRISEGDDFSAGTRGAYPQRTGRR